MRCKDKLRRYLVNKIELIMLLKCVKNLRHTIGVLDHLEPLVRTFLERAIGTVFIKQK
jgi:hypothetical protein